MTPIENDLKTLGGDKPNVFSVWTRLDLILAPRGDAGALPAERSKLN